MGPYGLVGAHIKTGKRYMAQDHFKTPPDPKKCHGMTQNPQTSKKSSRVGQGCDSFTMHVNEGASKWSLVRGKHTPY